VSGGPEFHNGDGPPGGGDENRPRIPSQREQHNAPDDLPFGPRPSGPPQHLSRPGPPDNPLLPAVPGVPLPAVPDQLSRYDHGTLKSLLGAWALSVCSRDEALAVEVHLTDCAACAEEALRLRDAVGLLHQEESLDLDPLLRARVLEGCLGRRPARIPLPEWAGPYDAEAARLDALLRDLGDGYWKAPVRLQWFDGAPVTQQFTVGQVISHLTAVDSLVARALGLPAEGADAADQPEHTLTGGRVPPRPGHCADDLPVDPWERTAAHWSLQQHLPGATLRSRWREQSHHLVRTVSFAGRGVAGLDVDYGESALPLRDAFLDRAFECWIHATDIAEAVDYPYNPPAPRHLHRLVDLAARLLPGALAQRRRAGLTTSVSRLAAAGAPGRSLWLEIEGDGGGDWYLPLDSPGAIASEEGMVAHVAMDSLEFCQLAAGHVEPERTAAGQLGDRAVIRDVLFAAASLSRL
jgi:Mycothiol maleylpyruvate isomerase N-terminal domain